MKLKVKNNHSESVIELFTDRLSVLVRDGDKVTRLPYHRAFLTNPTKKTFQKFCRELGSKFIQVVSDKTEHHRWFDYVDGELVLNRKAKSDYLKMENQIRLENEANEANAVKRRKANVARSNQQAKI